MLSINHNLSAANTASALSAHYSRLQTSTQRLSSGLRVNGAADDAAGLAIRELMRADIAALNQGTRNANDAISMLQTFDGALSVIDEKLIRMKELAEQASTGTYDSTQRLMIDSEFQAMASEINRIANATDFNGVKLLCTKLISWTTDEDQFVITNDGSIENQVLSGGQNAAITKNINAEKYVNENNPTKTISVSLTAQGGTKTEPGKLGTPIVSTLPDGTTRRSEYQLGDSEFKVAYVDVSGTAKNPEISYNKQTGWAIRDANHADPLFIFPPAAGATTIRGTAASGSPATIDFSMDDKNGSVDFSQFDANNPKILAISINTGTNDYSITRSTVEIAADEPDYKASYDEDTQTVTVTLKNGGGSVAMRLDSALAVGDTVNFDIELEGEMQTVPVEHFGPDPDQKVKIHFGTMNDSAEDYYYINYTNCTTEGLGIGGLEIKTQEQAQDALAQIRDAIVTKDQIRANYGALQNRFENTITNIRTQAENLQAAESRISDTDVALEMAMFVRNQILTQSAVAMLAQANSMPQMVMSLIS